MASHKVFLRRSVKKDLARLPKSDAARIVRRIGALAREPRPQGCEKLTGRDRYRIRQGDYRILYSIEDDRLIVIVVRVAQRGEAYRRGRG